MSKVLGTATVVGKIADLRRQAVGILSDDDIPKLLLKRMRMHFMRGETPDNNKWPALSPETVRTKKQKGYSRPNTPLYATGRLYDSLRIIQGSSAGLLATSTGAGVRIGVSDPIAAVYGRMQNYGLAGLPARQFIGLGRLDLAAVRALLARKAKSIQV